MTGTETSRPIVIAGGGTAGHILPGLSIAEALVAKGVARGDLVWVGSDRGQEVALVPPSGIELVALPGRGIQRKVTARALVDNLGALAGLLSAAFSAVSLVRRRRPAVVLMLGGYASAAAALAAVLCRVPIVIAEQNAVAGAANRLFGRFAVAAAVPFEGSNLPRARVTGNPVRDIILERRVAPEDREAQRRAARRELGIDEDRVVIAAFAGSLGSRRINEAVVGLAQRWSERCDLAFYHVVGRRDWERFEGPDLDGGRSGADGAAAVEYRAVEYEERMDLVLAAADLAICRCGGTTVAELAVVGVASVLVPLPIAPGDHQRHNAAALVRDHAAVLVDDDRCTAEHLEQVLAPLVADRPSLARMGEAAWRLGRPDAAAAVADLLVAQLPDPSILEGGR